jgi:DNA-binding transcriptional ArsR family regulator
MTNAKLYEEITSYATQFRSMTFKPSYFKADLFKVLSNPVRIQILDTLRVGEQSVGYIAEWLELEASAVSQQLSVLRSRNLVVSRKQGNFVFYSVRDPAIFKLLDAAMEVFNNHLVDVRDALEQFE